MKTKNLLTFIFILSFSIPPIFAQPPNSFNYQAVARDANGNLLSNRDISLRIQVIDINDNLVFEESHATQTDGTGLFTLGIGEGIANVGDFRNIDWPRGGFKLDVALDPNGGNNFTPMGRSLLRSVPYARHAETSNFPWESILDNVFVLNKRVGIGIAGPQNFLHIHNRDDLNEGAYTRYTSKTTGATNRDGMVVGYSKNQNAALVWNVENAPIRFGTNDKFRMMLSPEGVLGIGTGAPTHGLHLVHASASAGAGVRGVRIQNAGSNNNWWGLYTANGSGQFELAFNGTLRGVFNPTTGAYSARSDRQFKRDIQPLQPTLKKVLQLQPRSYFFKDTPNASRPSIGFIAQEVAEQFPELVVPAGENQDVLTIDYNAFSVLAIQAIQDQQELIEQLQLRISELERHLRK